MTVTELQALVLKLQSQINQLELTNKGADKALEFRLEAVLQANLDTFLASNLCNTSFLDAGRIYVSRIWFITSKSSINVALKKCNRLWNFCCNLLGIWICFNVWNQCVWIIWFKSSFFTTKVAGYQSFFVFQAMFVATAATIVSGAVAERLKFFSYVIITFITSGIIYPIVGHWVWSLNFFKPRC